MPISVILADDHLIFREGLKALLRTPGDIELLDQASNGPETWNLIEQLQPDIAIVDIYMPVMTGIEVARKAVAAGLPTQLVLLTACTEPHAAIDAQQAGAAGYVLKDSSFEELVVAVHTVAAGGTFMTPAIRAKLREMKQQGHTTGLSPRERQVIRLIGLGKTGKEIARMMGLSPRTVDTYRERLMEKLGAHTVADVVRHAVRVGLVD